MVERLTLMYFKLSSGLHNRLLLIFMLSCTPAFVGCGGGISGEGERVSGTVTVDGDLVESGSIAFKSFDDKTPAGTSIREGKYEAIVPRGKTRVEIRVPVVVGQRKLYDTPDSPLMDVTRESLPAKYHDQTELELEVVAGGNSKDWELVGIKKRK